MPLPIVFISFAPGDEAWASQVKTALTCIRHMDRLSCRDPANVAVGTSTNDAVRAAVGDCDATVVLVSMQYLSSARTRDVDVPAFLRRMDEVALPVVPVLIKPCPWQTVDWLAALQVFPGHGRALSGGTSHQIDLDLTDLAHLIDKTLP